jgi:hypothetical protein
MADDLPIYMIVGMRPIKMEETDDGGASISGWDWKKNDFVRGGGAEWAALSGYESPELGADSLDPDTPLLGGADSRTVTKVEFDAHVAKIKKR